jgi:hypothetical protein
MREHGARQTVVGVRGQRAVEWLISRRCANAMRGVRRSARCRQLQQLRLTVRIVILALAAVVGVQATQTIVPQTIATPAAANSAQPQLTVSKRGVLLSWIERNGDLATLKFSELRSGAWSAPRTVASGRDWFVNWADVPSVLRLPSGSLVAHWLQKSGPDTYAYDVRLSYSQDDGKTWSPSFLPHHDGAKAEHGFASLFAIGDGFGLVWLDPSTRDERASTSVARSGQAAHGGHDAAEMKLHYARFNSKWQEVENSVVDARVCECCPTTAAVTSDGIITAYRNRSDDEIRDNYVARLVNGKWSTPQPVFNDNWKIAACPVNGPSLSAHGELVAMTWFTAKNDQGQAYAAFSKDAGKTFGAPIRVDDGGTLGRVDVEMLPDGSALTTWIEFAEQAVAPKPSGEGGRAQFRARRIDTNGTRHGAVTISGMGNSRSSGYPRAAVANGQVVFAWTDSESGTLQVRTASARLP